MVVPLDGSAAAKIHHRKSGALVCSSFPTASHEKLNIASFVMPLSSDGLAVEHNRLHSFEILEHILLPIASFRFGLSIAASARALKLLPLASAFPWQTANGKRQIVRFLARLISDNSLQENLPGL